MMTSDSEAAVFRALFGDVPRTISSFSAGGFSGSRLLLVTVDAVAGAGSGAWVVKSFGPGTSPSHAAWVHSLMQHLRDRGIEQVPSVRGVANGSAWTRVHGRPATIVEDSGGRLWEAVRFLPGRPIDLPDAAGRGDAMRLLARVHLVAATLPDFPPRRARSRGLVERIDRAATLRERPWRRRWREARLDEVVARHGREVVPVFERAIEAFDGAGAAAVGRIAEREVSDCECQAVLRDIWSGHLLFDGDRVGGIIDFHAAGIDTVATDLARLVGSWRLVSPECSWDDCLAAYAEVRPLRDEERGLVPLLHHAGVIVAIDNWFRWIVEERRTFSDTAAVGRRIAELVESLPDAIDGILS